MGRVPVRPRTSVDPCSVRSAILSSGYDEAAAPAGEHAEQPQAFLRKPYEFELLRQAIHQTVPKSAPDPE